MTARTNIERVLDTFLAEGPETAADRAVLATLTAIDRTPQRRGPFAPWRFRPMTAYLRIATAAIVAVLVLRGALGLINSTNVPGAPVPTPNCTTAAAPTVSVAPGSTPLDRATWRMYVSTQFGFSICYPADWVVRTGDMAPDPSHPGYDGLDPTQVHFVAGNETIFLSAWSIAVAPGTTLDALVRATCAGYQITCPTWQTQATPVSVDGHAGYVALLGSCTNPACNTGWTEAFLLVDNRMYRVTSGRAPGEYDSDRLVRTFFSTMHLLPGGPVPAATTAPSE